MPRTLAVLMRDCVVSRYPKAAYLMLSITNVDNESVNTSFYDLVEGLARDSLDMNNEVLAIEQIEYWKSIYKDMNLSRKQGVSSFEALYKRCKKTGQLPAINPFVDLYNGISLNTRTCIGAYDARNVQGKIELKVVPDDEEMIAIGETNGLLAKRGSIAYYDDDGIICSYWNWRDANRTSIDSSTRDVIVAIDVGTDAGEAWRAAELLVRTATKYLGGQTSDPVMVSAQNPQHFHTLTEESSNE